MANKNFNMNNFNVVFFVSATSKSSKRVKAIVDRKEMNMIVVSGYDEVKMS